MLWCNLDSKGETTFWHNFILKTTLSFKSTSGCWTRNLLLHEVSAYPLEHKSERFVVSTVTKTKKFFVSVKISWYKVKIFSFYYCHLRTFVKESECKLFSDASFYNNSRVEQYILITYASSGNLLSLNSQIYFCCSVLLLPATCSTQGWWWDGKCHEANGLCDWYSR